MGQSAPRESRSREVSTLIAINGFIWTALALAYAKPLWNLLVTLIGGAIVSMVLFCQKSRRDLPLLPQFFTLSQLIVFAYLKTDSAVLRESLRTYYLFLFVFPMITAYAMAMTILPAAKRGIRRPSKEGFYSKLADISNMYPSLLYLSLAVVYMLVLAILDALIF